MDHPGLQPGALVRSLAGRDEGTCYVVLTQLDDGRVAVSNGRQRPIERPKAKNRRHLEVLGWVSNDLAQRIERGDRVSNEEVIKALAALPSRVLEEV